MLSVSLVRPLLGSMQEEMQDLLLNAMSNARTAVCTIISFQFGSHSPQPTSTKHCSDPYNNACAHVRVRPSRHRTDDRLCIHYPIFNFYRCTKAEGLGRYARLCVLQRMARGSLLYDGHRLLNDGPIIQESIHVCLNSFLGQSLASQSLRFIHMA